MRRVPPFRTLIVGLGNPILSDDGVGLLTARAVAARLPPGLSVDVVELCVGGLALMEAMIGYQHVVLIDAINTRDGVPGQVYRLGVDSLPGTMNTSSAHDANLATALHLGRLLGADLPEDEFIDVVAIEVEDVLTFKDEPTPPVSAAIPVAADLVMAVLAETHMPVKEG